MKVHIDYEPGSFSKRLKPELVSGLRKVLDPVTRELVLSVSEENVLPDEARFSIFLVDEEEIRALNLEYLGEDSPTDVLSFPVFDFEHDGVFHSDAPLVLLGDIVICPPQVAANARVAGHSFARELSLVLIHGILHIFGMDHDTEEKREAMWKKQEQYWDKIEEALYPLEWDR
ncbi:MAG TPA: rRNA maturation RNase YbeY [Synergistales bacterium]|nr:rRNA maturation RNase YbeY [Synergistales bacterium]HRV70682.1 rRNA maturation RNase YbeY [Thermovirgaceae bacterium]